MQDDFKEELSTAKMELQEQVLSDISAEMHDNLGQMLSVAKLNILKLGRMFAKESPEGEAVEELKEQISGVIEDVRSISKTLSKDFISNFGLEQSLAVELEKINRTGIVTAQLKINGEDEGLLDGQYQIALFRVAQEILNNAIKHAQANTITVTINYLPKLLHLIITDDGKGFDMNETTTRAGTKSGNGLKNMQTRVKNIGGVLTLSSILGKGTTVKIEVNTENSLFVNQNN